MRLDRLAVTGAAAMLLAACSSQFAGGASGGVTGSCLLGGLSTSGSTASFACNQTSCSCTLGSASFQVTSASATLVNDQLSVTMGGTGSGGNAFSGTFTGALEAGTR
jgi:hypothetical protein